MRFEWDPSKAEANRRKHGVTFEEAQSLLVGVADYLEIYDREHSQEEDRFIAVGPIESGVICVVYTERDDGSFRIIGARKATRREVDILYRYMGEHRS